MFDGADVTSHADGKRAQREGQDPRQPDVVLVTFLLRRRGLTKSLNDGILEFDTRCCVPVSFRRRGRTEMAAIYRDLLSCYRSPALNTVLCFSAVDLFSQP